MTISINEMKQTAELARIDLTEDEAELYAKQLGAIIEQAAKLRDLNTEDIVPTTHGLISSNVMRDDEQRSSWPMEKMMQNVPEAEDNQIKVPAILD